MKKHRRLKIGGHSYKIIRDPTLISRKGLWGSVNHIDRSVTIDSSVNPSDYLATIVHEGLEAIKANRELVMDHTTLTNVEDGLHAMLVDNKHLIMDLLRYVR